MTGLDGLVRQIVVTEDHVADEDKRAVHEAVAAFLAVDRRALGAASAEHGLQIVFRGRHTVSKVGPFDGHLTNADAFGREGLDSVVYVSPFAR